MKINFELSSRSEVIFEDNNLNIQKDQDSITLDTEELENFIIFMGILPKIINKLSETRICSLDPIS